MLMEVHNDDDGADNYDSCHGDDDKMTYILIQIEID